MAPTAPRRGPAPGGGASGLAGRANCERRRTSSVWPNRHPDADAVLVEPRVPHAAGRQRHLRSTWRWRARCASAGSPVAMVLAGGLTPETVADAVALVRPDVVDVSSGVERLPGIKDPDKIARFLEAVLGHSPRSPERAVAGRFGPYGGRYVPETLVAALDELDRALRRRPGRPRVLGRARRAAGRVRRPPVAAHRGAAALPRRSARRCSSSGRT